MTAAEPAGPPSRSDAAGPDPAGSPSGSFLESPGPLTARLSVDVEHWVARSRDRARAGDVRGAVLAQCAADVKTLQLLLWEHGLADVPDPTAQLWEVARAVDDGVTARVDAQVATEPPATGSTAAESTAGGPVSAAALVQAVRDGMASAFDPSVRALLTVQLPDTGHLDLLADVDVAPRPPPYRAVDRPPADLVAQLMTLACDARAVARELDRAGEAVTASAQEHLADLATFEAFLVHAAAAVGDTRLVTVGARWELADTLLTDSGLGDGAPDLAPPVLRRRLCELVGATEEEELRTWFRLTGAPDP